MVNVYSSISSMMVIPAIIGRLFSRVEFRRT
jgi:hypothetical protein